MGRERLLSGNDVGSKRCNSNLSYKGRPREASGKMMRRGSQRTKVSASERSLSELSLDSDFTEKAGADPR